MATKLIFICHATTRDLRAATFGGDDTLDDVGRRQAEKAAGSLGRVDQSWSSPATRCKETASILGLTPTIEPRLRECDFGRWNGLRLQQVMFKEPRKLMSWIKNPSAAPHGGETIQHVMDRVSSWMQDRIKDKGVTVAIAHASVIRAAIVHVIEAQLPSFWRVDVSPLSRTEFRTNGRRWVLRSLGPIAGNEGAE